MFLPVAFEVPSREDLVTHAIVRLTLFPTLLASLMTASTQSWALPVSTNAQAHCSCSCGGVAVDVIWKKTADACVARNGNSCTAGNKKTTYKDCTTYVLITKPVQGVNPVLHGPGVFANPR